jgi:hypothetical protein
MSTTIDTALTGSARPDYAKPAAPRHAAEAFTINIAELNSVDVIGEVLRDYCFVPENLKNSLGCYSTFDVRPEFEKLHPGSPDFERVLLAMTFSPEHLEEEPELLERISAYSNGTLSFGWHWDGDGLLAFALGDLGFVNTDCKKTYGWSAVSLTDRMLSSFYGIDGLTAHQRTKLVADPDYGPINAAVIGLEMLRRRNLRSFDWLEVHEDLLSDLLLAALPQPINMTRLKRYVEPIVEEVERCIGKYHRTHDIVRLKAALGYLRIAAGSSKDPG